MIGMQIRSYPFKAGKDWYVEGWDLLRKDPFKNVGVGLCMAIFPVLFSYFPLIGKFIAPLISSALTLGFYVYAKELEKEGTGRFKNLFIILEEKAVLQRLIPYFVASVFMSLIVAGVSSLHLPFAGAWGLCIYLLWVAGTVFSLPMIYEGKDFFSSVRVNFEATHRNWVPFVAMALVGLAALILSLIPLGLGVVIFIPLSHFAWYRSFKNILSH